MDYQNTGSGNSSAFNQFTGATNNYVNSTQEFLESNSLVAKVAFLLLVLFVFVLLFRLGMVLLEYFLTPSNNPMIIDGMVDAKQLVVIPQDPDNPNAITIKRSVNANDGIEFTWSVWIFIDDLTYNSGQYRCVFYKGNDFSSNPNTATEEQQGLNFPNNAPGVYIAPNTNNLVIMMNTFNVINEEVTVEDIPINKWFNLIIRCQNTTLDVYMNGLIVKSYELHGVPKQNYGDIYVAANGGFSGNISNLHYYSYALGTSEINRLVTRGPNTNMKNSLLASMKMKNPNYLSLRWYFYGNSA
jgi:hypothetical protein